MDVFVSGFDSTLSISATNWTCEFEHKDVPKCFFKSKTSFNIPGYCGSEMISLQTDITYVVNTENLVKKASHLKDKCFILHVMVMET